jgi:hypothetical protein
MSGRHLAQGTPEWHAFNVGMLVTNLELLEFYARLHIAKGAGLPAYLWTLKAGDLVAENPITNYDQLRVVLHRFVNLTGRQLDIDALVELRDHLAHGRVIPHSSTEAFPLTLLKFGKPEKGAMPVLARIQMDDAWFKQQRALVDRAINIVGPIWW